MDPGRRPLSVIVALIHSLMKIRPLLVSVPDVVSKNKAKSVPDTFTNWSKIVLSLCNLKYTNTSY